MLTELTPLDLKFIEVAARVIHGAAWARTGLCGYTFGNQQTCQHYEKHPRHGPDNPDADIHAFRPRDWSKAPTHPSQGARDIAASLHGRLLERNGVRSVDEIVRAAIAAEVERCLAGGFDQNGYCKTCGEVFSSHAERVENPSISWTDAFFRAVAIEAMGGEKDSADFVLPCGRARGCLKEHSEDLSENYGHTFSVPSIKIEQEFTDAAI